MALPVQLGIVVGVYLGTRLWRYLRRAPATPAPSAATPQPLAVEDDQSVEQLVAFHGHHFQLSAFTIASTSLGSWLYPPMGLFNLGLLTYNSVPMLDAATHSLGRQRRVRFDSYSALISLLCLASGNYFAAAIHNTGFHLGCRMVQTSKQQSRRQLREVFAGQPDNVWILRENTEIELPLSEVQVGDRVMVHTGELIPVDGKIHAGRGLVDQQNLTGEAQPQEKFEGDTVLATTLLLGGQLVVTATRSGADSKAHRLNEILQHTEEFKTNLQLRGEQWSDRATLPLLITSGVMWPVAGLGTATALLFSAPINTVRSLLSLQTSSHMQWAAERGIFIKDGRVLEEMLRVDTILFDKTGTLTEPQPTVERLIPCASLAAEPLLAYAAAAEQHLHHPIASALLAAAEERDLLLPPIRDSRYDMGMGVSVSIGSRRVQVGSARFIQDISGDPQLPRVISEAMAGAEGSTFILVAVDGRIQGAIELTPRLRPDVIPMLQALRLRGLHRLGVVSGDRQAPTARLARELGLDAVYAEMLPQEKAGLIRRLQAQGHRVCFVGDGLNDAIAMKQANVSICPGGAVDLTRDTAQIVLLNDRLESLPEALDMAAHLHLRLAASLGFWIGFGAFNALCVPLLQFGPAQSSLLYGGAFGMGFHRARSPGLLAKELSDASREPMDIHPEDEHPGALYPLQDPRTQ